MVECLYLGGVEGVGKSSLLQDALKTINKKIVVGKGSEIMKELAGLKSVSELRNLNPDNRLELRLRAHETMFKWNVDMVLDGHYAIPTRDDYEIPFDHRYAHRISAFCIVVGNPEIIYQRRLNDSKPRSRILIEKLTRDLDREYKVAQNLSTMYYKALYVVSNNSDKETAVAYFKQVLEKVFKC